MLKILKECIYNRDILIGLPNLTLKDFKCKNITCGKADKFKKYKGNYLCECGYIAIGEFEIEKTHKVRLYCKNGKCAFGKTKMDTECIKCKYIAER